MRRTRRKTTTILALTAMLLAVLVPQLSAIAEESSGETAEPVNLDPTETETAASTSGASELDDDEPDSGDQGSAAEGEVIVSEATAPDVAAEGLIDPSEEPVAMSQSEAIAESIDTLDIDVHDYLPNFVDATCENTSPQIRLPNEQDLPSFLRYVSPESPGAGDHVQVDLELEIKSVTNPSDPIWQWQWTLEWTRIWSWDHTFEVPTCACAELGTVSGYSGAKRFLTVSTTPNAELLTSKATIGLRNLVDLPFPCTIDVAFSSYLLPNGERDPIRDQVHFDSAEVLTVDTGSFEEGSLTVDLPGCGFQTDVYVTDRSWSTTVAGIGFDNGIAMSLANNGHGGLYITGDQYGIWPSNHLLVPSGFAEDRYDCSEAPKLQLVPMCADELDFVWDVINDNDASVNYRVQVYKDGWQTVEELESLSAEPGRTSTAFRTDDDAQTRLQSQDGAAIGGTPVVQPPSSPTATPASRRWSLQRSGSMPMATSPTPRSTSSGS